MQASGGRRPSAIPEHRDDDPEPDGETSPATTEPSPNGKGRPDVTVVVTTFNRFDLLSRALASVFAQVDTVLEVVVVDDASSDGTLHRLAAAAARDPRLRVIRQPYNQGVARARNRGIAAARGRWIAFLDDDDFWAPTRLRELLRAAEAASASWVYGSVWWTDAEGRPLWVVKARPPADLATHLFDDNVVGTPSTVMARADVVRAAGDFDERLDVLADWDYWLRLAPLGKAAACLEPLVAYIEHDDNMQLRQSTEIPDELAYLAAKHRAAAAAAGAQIGGPIYQRWLARVHQRAGRRFRAASTYARVGIRYGDRRDVVVAAGLLVGAQARAAVRTLRRHPTVRPTPRAPAPTWLVAGFEARLPSESSVAADAELPAATVAAGGAGGERRMPAPGLARRLRQAMPKPVKATGRDARRAFVLAGVLSGSARLTPLSRRFGYDRGKPIDRYFIEDFIRRHGSVDGYAGGDIRGAVLEVGDDVYARSYGDSGAATSIGVLHVDPSNPKATVIGDLVTGAGLQDEAFDCIICTQTLHVIYDVRSALSHLHRALRPGGVLLATVAGISQSCRPDRDLWGDYWRFTSASAQRLTEEVFHGGTVTVESYGNVFAAAAFLYGMATHELRAAELELRDPDYEMLIAIRAQKAPAPQGDH